jgi:predicted O-methyltransferase YrrM
MSIEPGRQRTNLLNVVRFTLARPQALAILAGKVVKRVKDRSSSASLADSLEWIDSSAISSAALAQQVDPTLWGEALEFGENLRTRAKKILSEVRFDIGGGGNYEFLYWLTRHQRPTFVVETGVAAGWSSEAFLAAMEANDHGTLYSSDFPYFRVRDPQRYIGVIVSERLKGRWRLSTDGDEKALPRIVAEIPHVDLFHYDSDKSYSGMQFGVSAIAAKLARDGVIIIDDIRDNCWFHDFAATTEWDHAVLDGRCGLLDPSCRLLCPIPNVQPS